MNNSTKDLRVDEKNVVANIKDVSVDFPVELVEEAVEFEILGSLEQRIAGLEARMEEFERNNAAVKAIEMTIAKLEPTQDDIIVFWMPKSLTHVQIQRIGQSFDAVIGGRFRYILLVRGSVEIEMISKSPGLLRIQ